MSPWVDASAAYIGAHPHWAGVLVFLIAASEAVVLVGMVIPGTAILLAIGGVIGLGHLSLTPILIWAAAGAIAGDGFSYWLGHTYREGLRLRWPFSRYPELIDQGEKFFQRHGGKSVLFGRFIPVLKPIVPVVAGILGMPPGRFYLANVFSAVLWSPAHILPGVLIGASLGLLHGISPRLVVAALGVLVAVVLLAWSTRLIVARLGPVLERLHRRAFGRATRRAGTLAYRLAAPFDPDHPGTPALVATIVVLLVTTIGFLWVLEDVVTNDPLVQADRAISHLMSGLRNPWTDPAMILATSLGDAAVTAPVALAVLGWLAVHRAWRLCGVVALALALTGIAVPLLKAVVHLPRPEALYTGVDAYAFPSGHTTIAAVLYGTIAWLIAGGLGARARGAVYTVFLILVLSVAVSRVYLGAHWPSDVLAGFFLGTAAAASVALLYRHAPRDRIRAGGLTAIFVVTLVIAAVLHVERTFEAQVARYLPRETHIVMTESDWRDGRWRDLPARRTDLGGEPEELLTVQWLGDPAALGARLLAAGWRRPPDWTIASAAGFLKPGTGLAALPALPTLQDGRKPILMLVKPDTDANSRSVFRAWTSGVEVTRDGASPRPLLLASVVREREIHPGGVLSLVRATPHRDTPPASVFTAHGGFRIERAAPRAYVWLGGEDQGG